VNRITGTEPGAAVYLDGERLELRPSLRLWNHSPTGFAWGYAGSGPAQLALAILLQFTDRFTAVRLHQQFKFEQVAAWPEGALDVTVDVPAWLAAADPKGVA
jgi:hypothetical protein